jgi:pimeloyl-ACP methyl ester carboxylesterase
MKLSATISSAARESRSGYRGRRLLGLALAAIVWAVVAGTVDAAPDADRYESPGPYQVKVMPEALCCDRKGRAIDLYLPVANVKGQRMPLVLWGNGTWASPEKYDFLLRHLASWGMVIAATRDNAVARGETMLDTLAVLHDEGAPVEIDFDRVATAGHSQGAGGAANAAVAASHVDTVVAIDLPARNHCSPGDCENIPSGLPDGVSVLFLSGERDPLSPPDAVDAYYQAVPGGLLKAKGMVVDADHNDIQGQPECGFLAIGCRHGVEGFLPYVTAWLVWRLKTDAAAGRLFVGHGAAFLTDPRLSGAEVLHQGR